MLVLCVLFSLIAPLLGGQYKTVQDYSQPKACDNGEMKGCNGDPNASFSECPYYDPPSCEYPDPEDCSPDCAPPGCECNIGYVLSSKGKCVKWEQCPSCNGDTNATYTDCLSNCPPTCDNPAPICIAMCMYSGCQCRKGYVQGRNGCILPQDCPVKPTCKDPNSSYNECPSSCPPSCKNPKPEVCTADCAPSGCECNPGFVLSDKGKCIKREQCPSCNGDRNATYTECTPACYPSCEKLDPICIQSCRPPGCQCKEGYIQSSNGCILRKDCPVKPKCKDPNSSYSECPSACPATCDNPKPEICIQMCNPKGCQCNPGYVLFKDKCILPENCPVNTGCPRRCKPTCSYPNPQNCKKNFNCDCKVGYIWDDYKMHCIPIRDCPQDAGCNGDPNAIIQETPIACPSTCDRPDQLPCDSGSVPVGCVCKPGYIFSEMGGKCITPDSCPYGNPCRDNTTYASCAVECSSYNYCPADDSRAIFMCSIAYPCPSGCVCSFRYKRKSFSDRQCLLGEDCPSFNCTRKNEKLNKCPMPCYGDSCSDVKYKDFPCNTCVAVDCRPQCQCAPGFARNASDECVPEDECPVEAEPEIRAAV